EHTLPGGRVASSGLRGRRRFAARCWRFARMTGSGAGPGRCDWSKCPCEREEPEVVAVCGSGERVAAGEEGDVLVSSPAEDGRRVVRACAGLEAPEKRTGLRVVRLQLAVVASDEHEVPVRRSRAGVARIADPFALPPYRASACIDRS